MRLGQLARKLEVKPSDIVGYLATKNIQIEENANTKLDLPYVTEVLRHFAPHLEPALVSDKDLPIVDTPEVLQHTTVDIPEQPNPVSPPITLSDDKQEETEIIKAPKIELSGLKVLGKIELPEPKKKPDVSSENDPSAPIQAPREIKKEKRNSFENRKPRPQKNSIAQKREQEAIEAQRKKDEQLRLQKERKTQNYLKKVKAQQPTKAARLLRENTVEMSAQDLAEQPKTWWGKFLKWLTT